MLNLLRLTLWLIVWIIAWIVATPFRKKGYDNCITHALKKWDENPDGYIVIRWCRNNKTRALRWPHMLWLDPNDHEKLEHAVSKKFIKRTLPQIWFEPVIVHSDPKDEEK